MKNILMPIERSFGFELIMNKEEKMCDRCKGKGYYYATKTIEWTWEHGFKEPKTEMVYKVPCQCVINRKERGEDEILSSDCLWG